MRSKILAIIIILILLLNVLSTVIFAFENEKNTEENNINTNINNINTSNNTENVTNNIQNNEINNSIEENITENGNNTIDNTTTGNITEDGNNVISNTITENITQNENNVISNTTTENDNTEKKEEPMQMLTMVQSDQQDESGQINYTTHVQELGWSQGWIKDGNMAGTSGKSYRLEGIKIKLNSSLEEKGIKVKYQVHVQDVGWQDWKENGEMAGTSGRSLRLEAIRIRLENTEDYSVKYRVHIQELGWSQGWVTDGEMAGTSGRSYRLEAIEIQIIPKVKKATVCVDSFPNNQVFYKPETINVSGWKMANISNTKIVAYINGSNTPIDESKIKYRARNDVIAVVTGYGSIEENPTPGYAFSFDASEIESGNCSIKVDVVSSKNEVLSSSIINIKIDREIHVKYQSHIQDIGWQREIIDSNNGEISGTSGLSKRIEAMKIQLINNEVGQNIIYRTHVEGIGWQNWQSNGNISGTSGRGLRIEAIEIKLEKLDSYTVEYQVHIQDYGWSNWYIDGETAGTVGQSKRIEAIRIRIVPKYRRANTGMDVSAHQGKIDWNQVKQSGQIDFVMLRCGYGKDDTSQDDTYFTRNLAECERLGIPYGVYLYSYALTGEAAYSEAEHVLRLINGHYPSYGIWIDMEDADGYKARYGEEYGIHMEKENDQYTNNVLTDICINFCNKIEQYGYRAGVYASYNWLTNRLNDGRIDKFDIWVAQWNYKCDYNKPYIIWQYTNNGSVPGILTPVDMDKYCK